MTLINALVDAAHFVGLARSCYRRKSMGTRFMNLTMDLVALLVEACFMRSKGIVSIFTNTELDAVMMTLLLAHDTMTFLLIMKAKVCVEFVKNTVKKVS